MIQKERHARGENWLSYVALAKELTRWRHDPDTSWLAESPCQTQQQAIRDLDKAYRMFCAKVVSRPPRIKKKGRATDSFRCSDPMTFQVDSVGGRVRIPKIGWVRYHNSRPVVGTPKNITVSRRGAYWYVSIQVEQDVPEPVHPSPGSAVGVDMGIVNFATLSTGEQIPPLNAFRAIREKLARLQRELARKVKFSANWRKLREKVAKLYERSASRRADYLHKLSTALSKNHALIVVEDLQVANMSASASGTIENPGRNVAQKVGINRAIRDQGWGEFVRQLGYKTEWRGGQLVKVSPAYTSRTCSKCGHEAGESRPSQAVFQCVACGHAANADVNAATNVLAAGHAVIACGGDAAQGRPGETGIARPSGRATVKSTTVLHRRN